MLALRIQTRIISAAILVIAVATIVYSLYFIRTERANALARFRTIRIEENDKLLKIVTARPLYDGNVEQLEAMLDSFFSNPDMIRIELREYKGNIRLSRIRPPMAAMGELITSRVEIVQGIDELGEITVTYSTARLEKSLQVSRNQILVFSGMLALGLSGIIYLVVKGLTRPIERLTVAARDMADGHLDRDFDARGAAELQSLGQSFVSMRDAIREKMADLAARNEALRESEERLRLALTAANQGLYDLNIQTGETKVSPEYAAMLGYDPAEFQETNARWIERLHPDDHDRVAEAYRAYVRGDIPSYAVEFRQRTRSGDWKWILSVGKIVSRDGEGNPLRMLGTHTDITERKRIEAALREADQRYKLVMEGIGVGIWEFNMQKNDSYLSPKYHELLEYKPGELTGTYEEWMGQVYPDDRARVSNVMQRHLEAREPYDVEYRIQTKSGSYRWFQANGQALWDETGRPILMTGSIADITERKRAEEEQQKLVSIIETSSDFIGIADLNGQLLYVNAAGRSLVGLDSIEEIGSKRISDFLRQKDLTILEKEQLPSIEQSGSWTGELAMRHFKTGIPIPVDMNAFMIRDRSTGRPIALANISRDITERKRVEDALRESRNLLRIVLDTIPVRVFWKDRDLRYLGCNQPFALDAGVNSPDEMIGKDDYQMGWREQAELYRSDDRQVLESGKPKLHYEEPQTTPNGQRMWLRTNKVPLQNADGTIWGILGTYEDITEYKRAEESLRQAGLIVENSPVMLFRWKASEGWPVALVSQNVVQLGYTTEELLDGSVPFASMVHPEDLERVGREVQTYTANGVDRFQQEYRLVTKDGHVRWIDDRTLVERDAARRVTHYQGIVVDITERKRADAERERLIGELELRNAELERFTYTVSHDLKSPLITMRGFLGYLEKDALAGNTERIRADIGRITDATDKMDRLLRELLELSRIGRAMNPPEQVPFEEVAREAVGLVAGRIQERGIRVEIATGMPVVSGDRVRLVEVMQNLVDNAAKFMGSQPEPRIEIGMRGEERNGKPVFFIRDNGIGIEPRYQEKIFGLFDKLDPKTEGTGIGLAIVKRIIEVHGGTIWLESQGHGSGATFCFTLPCAQTTARNGG